MRFELNVLRNKNPSLSPILLVDMPSLGIQVAALFTLCVVWVWSALFLELARFGRRTPSLPWMIMVRPARFWGCRQILTDRSKETKAENMYVCAIYSNLEFSRLSILIFRVLKLR